MSVLLEALVIAESALSDLRHEKRAAEVLPVVRAAIALQEDPTAAMKAAQGAVLDAVHSLVSILTQLETRANLPRVDAPHDTPSQFTRL